jgi:hypothetical protein
MNRDGTECFDIFKDEEFIALNKQHILNILTCLTEKEIMYSIIVEFESFTFVPELSKNIESAFSSKIRLEMGRGDIGRLNVSLDENSIEVIVFIDDLPRNVQIEISGIQEIVADETEIFKNKIKYENKKISYKEKSIACFKENVKNSHLVG